MRYHNQYDSVVHPGNPQFEKCNQTIPDKLNKVSYDYVRQRATSVDVGTIPNASVNSFPTGTPASPTFSLHGERFVRGLREVYHAIEKKEFVTASSGSTRNTTW